MKSTKATAQAIPNTQFHGGPAFLGRRRTPRAVAVVVLASVHQMNRSASWISRLSANVALGR